MVTVLYVDDNNDWLETFCPPLREKGHKVIEAGNGQQGLEALAKDMPFDIIFSDYRMPIVDGYNFCKAVKTDPKYVRHSRVPIVGVGDFPDGKREFLAKFLPKPFTPNDLIRCITEYCK